VPLWRGDHVATKQLVEDFARYLYLPRIKEPGVLLQSIRDGIGLLTWSRDSFAFAESYDEAAGRYRGLRYGQMVAVSLDDTMNLLVKPEVAQQQTNMEAAAGGETVGPSAGGQTTTATGSVVAGTATGTPTPPARQSAGLVWATTVTRHRLVVSLPLRLREECFIVCNARWIFQNTRPSP
jgi:hypothetical protein